MEDELDYPPGAEPEKPAAEPPKEETPEEEVPEEEAPEGDTPKPDEEKPSEAEKPEDEHVTVEQDDPRAVNLSKREGAVAVASPRPANCGCR